MKYFFDTEFVEGTQKKLFGKTKPTIDLISIGIVAENGREYYAISKDFNIKEAWNRHELIDTKETINRYIPDYCIRDNVLKSIWVELIDEENFSSFGEHLIDGELDGVKMSYRILRKLVEAYGKSNKQIAKEILEFVADIGLKAKSTLEDRIELDKPMFYGYYADYDWVVFCWLFGKMIDMPRGFPWYCVDLKQILDERASLLTSAELSKLVYSKDMSHNVYSTLDSGVLKCTKTDLLKKHSDYPKQENEHNALDDAKWNLKLFNFLSTIRPNKSH